MSGHAQPGVRFHAELRRLRGRPEAVVHRSGILTGYGLESLLDACRSAGRVDLALEDDPDPEILAWLQERLSRAQARGVRIFVQRGSHFGLRKTVARRSRSRGLNAPDDATQEAVP